MWALADKRLLTLTMLAGVFFAALAWQHPTFAGGPIAVGGRFGVDGEPFVWDTATEIPYRTDGPTTSTDTALGKLTKAEADTRVEAMFQVWEDVTTATIGFNRAGNLKSATDPDTGFTFSDGDVDTMEEFNAVSASCGDERQDATKQSPIIYDVDGSLFSDLGESAAVIGFAGPCRMIGGVNRISGGSAALNGKWIDGKPVFELTPGEFDQAFVHEFGHFSGLDHSQINVEVLDNPAERTADKMFGLPLMFPRLLSPARVEQTPPFPPLAPDDEARISFLYPATSFGTEFGTITGTIRFSDGQTHLQGGNVIARQVDDPATPTEDESRRFAVSVVSGYRFTGNPGQSITGTNPGSDFGSRDPTRIGFYEIPLRAGDYTVEVEAIDSQFTDGSSVGPLGDTFPRGASEQFRLPGPPEFWNLGEAETDDPAAFDLVAVTANGTVSDVDIILNGTPTRFDAFEGSARLWLRELAPPWVRRQVPLADRVSG